MHLIYRKPAHNAVTAERALVNLNLVDYKKSQKNFFPMQQHGFRLKFRACFKTKIYGSFIIYICNIYVYVTCLQATALALTQNKQLDIWPLSFKITAIHKNSISPESIYGKEGWWVGNPCKRASGVKYQSCYLWGEPSTAVETPWCQRHAYYSFISQIGLDTLRRPWPVLMEGDVRMRSSNNTKLRRPHTPRLWASLR